MLANNDTNPNTQILLCSQRKSLYILNLTFFSRTAIQPRNGIERHTHTLRNTAQMLSRTQRALEPGGGVCLRGRRLAAAAT